MKVAEMMGRCEVFREKRWCPAELASARLMGGDDDDDLVLLSVERRVCTPGSRVLWVKR